MERKWKMIKRLILLVSAKESDCYKISPFYLIRILYCVSNFLIDFFDDTRLDILCTQVYRWKTRARHFVGDSKGWSRLSDDRELETG